MHSAESVIPTSPAEAPAGRALSPRRALLVPVAFGLGAALPALIPSFRAHPVLFPTFVGAGAFIVAWAFWLYQGVVEEERTLRCQVTVRTPHWIQTCAQGALLLYWAWHVPPVLGNLPFLFGQLMFAYGLDVLLQWSRRDRYELGFGPIPIILSINFFLWFKPDWYYAQFFIIALGFAAKTFIHWERDGRRRHIFNPSSFPLAVFSLGLILTGTTDFTLGLEIAQTLFNPPNMYWAIFLVALPAQMLFGVTTMTLASVVTAYLWSLLYFEVTGTYFFRDAYVPIAVFLGMHLLFTDPATSPRTETGRVVFGVLYAVLTIGFAALLEGTGVPTFYDKLLPIPILNLMVRRIDQVAAYIVEVVPGALVAADRALGPVRHRLAVVAVWVAVFGGMAASGGMGDEHPGQYFPFWAQACSEGSDRACEYAAFMTTTFCDRGSGWACNELGIHRAVVDDDRAGALRAMTRSCDLGYNPGCRNVLQLSGGWTELARGEPPLAELPIVVRGSKGAVRESTPEALYALACDRGWTYACGRTAAADPGTR